MHVATAGEVARVGRPRSRRKRLRGSGHPSLGASGSTATSLSSTRALCRRSMHQNLLLSTSTSSSTSWVPLLADAKAVGVEFTIFDPDLDEDGRLAAKITRSLSRAFTSASAMARVN